MTVKGVFSDGAVKLESVPDWPDGCAVQVEPVGEPTRIGIDEADWRDDPAALADWQQWLASIEPFEFTPEEERDRAEFERAMREYNREAVRKQFLAEPNP